MRIVHLALDLSPWDQCGNRVNDDDVNRGCCELEPMTSNACSPVSADIVSVADVHPEDCGSWRPERAQRR